MHHEKVLSPRYLGFDVIDVILQAKVKQIWILLLVAVLHECLPSSNVHYAYKLLLSSNFIHKQGPRQKLSPKYRGHILEWTLLEETSSLILKGTL